MSNRTPIIPLGSPLHRAHPDNASKLFVTVFAVLAVHITLLAGLLIQGCKREDRNASVPPNAPTNFQESAQALARPPAAAEEPLRPSAQTNPPLATPAPAVTRVEPGVPVASMEPSAATNVTAVAPQANAPTTTPPPAVEGESPSTVYVVKSGDTLTRIAKTHGTTVQAIRTANGLKTDRIVVGQKLKISPKPEIRGPK
jgi:LysM repeat protein